MAVTIKDIAKQANVSIATVSRVLANKTEYNSVKTVKRVQKIAKELGYQKNTAAVELVTKSSNVIAVIVQATKTNFAEQIINGIHEEAYRNRLNVIIIYAGENDEDRQLESIQTVIERSVKGILLLAIDISKTSQELLTHSQIPFVALTIANDQAIPFISSDDFQIGYQATEFLIQQGHHQIGLAGLDTNSFVGQQRVAGYQAALTKHDIIPNADWITTGLFTYDDGLKAMQHYGSHPLVTAVVAASDMVGIGILNQATTFNLKVPDELSIISIDGTELCTIVRPQLTSVTQSFEQMGIKGVNYLLQTGNQELSNQFTQFQIVKRDSTKKVHSAE